MHREIYTETREPIIGSGSTTAAVKGVPPTDGVIADAHAQVTSLGSSVDAHKTTAVSGVDSSGLRKRVDHVEVTKTSVIKETPPPPPLPHLAPRTRSSTLTPTTSLSSSRRAPRRICTTLSSSLDSLPRTTLTPRSETVSAMSCWSSSSSPTLSLTEPPPTPTSTTSCTTCDPTILET